MSIWKVGTVCVLLMLAIGSMGCSTMTVKYDYDHHVDFTTYDNYDWIDQKGAFSGGTFGGNPLNYQRAQRAVDEELKARGHSLDEDNPSFLVALHGGVQDKINVQTWGYHYGYPGYWGMPYVDVQHYKEGTLIIDFIDTESHDLIWRGWATGAVERTDDPVGRIFDAVRKIMKNWPPR